MLSGTLLHTDNLVVAAEEIRRSGWKVSQAFGDRLIVADLPAGAAAQLRHSTESIPSTLDPVLRLAAQAWRNNLTPDRCARAPEETEGLKWDTPGYPAPLFIRDPAVPENSALGLGSSNVLKGKCALGLVIVSGPGELRFKDAELEKTLRETQAALHFFISARHSASIEFNTLPIPVSVMALPCHDHDHCKHDYEICEAPWRDAALEQIGYAKGLTGVQQFVDDLKKKYGAGFGYVTFVTKYPLCHTAYASLGGPRVCMNYDLKGWGVDNFHRALAHETAHIFNAPDEYASAGGACDDKYGVLDVPNFNSVKCSKSPHVACLMDENSLQLCDYTKWSVGWSNKLLVDAQVLGPAGGVGGRPFEAAPLPAKAKVCRISVRSAGRIDAVGISYTLDGVVTHRPMNGGGGGTEETFDLGDDERVVRLEGRFGAGVDSLTIVTDKRKSPRYGGDGGGAAYAFNIPVGYEFIGFSGRGSAEIDALGICVRAVPRTSGGEVTAMGPSGGQGGTSFHDRIPTGARITKVRIRHAGAIDAIGITYQLNGEVHHLPMRGGSGGVEESFDIPDGDYLVGISGRYGRVIDSLILRTANGVYSKRFGGAGGVADFSYRLGTGTMEIRGIRGGAGWGIGGLLDSLGVDFSYVLGSSPA